MIRLFLFSGGFSIAVACAAPAFAACGGNGLIGTCPDNNAVASAAGEPGDPPLPGPISPKSGIPDFGPADMPLTNSTGMMEDDGNPAAAQPHAADTPDDFFCTRAPAGKAMPVPAPFDKWLVRVCSPQGQALIPVEGEAWVAHGSADPLSILATPPDTVPMPQTGNFDPRYDIRFVGFEGGKTEGGRLKQAVDFLEIASGQEPVPAHDEVWQLDAATNIAGEHYNIFFYIEGIEADGGRPHHVIACLDQCRRALFLDVLSGVEAREITAP